MNRAERIVNTLNHKESDYIPYNMEFTEVAFDKTAKHFGERDFFDKINNHLIAAGPDEFVEGPAHFFTDKFGVLWNRTVDTDIGIVSNTLIPDYETRSYQFPKINAESVNQSLDYLKNEKNDRFAIFNVGFSMFERAWTLRGMEDILVDMVLNQSQLHALLEEITEYNLKMIDMAVQHDFIDAIMFGDDWGSQRSLIMGRDMWVEFIKPCMKQMYMKAKSNGKFVFQHSCGNIIDIFPDLIEIGLDCYQTFQPEIYDIEKVKREYGGDLTFWGGISTQQLLPTAPAEVVKAETIKMMKTMGQNGGYIAAPTHAMPGDIPLENILAMFEVFTNQQKYLQK